MTVCRECQNLMNRSLNNKIYYYDEICTIIEDGNRILGVYNYHQTPKPHQKKWISLQTEIWCKRRWSKEYKLTENLAEHPIWEGIAKTGRRQKKIWKTLEPQAKCGNAKLKD